MSKVIFKIFSFEVSFYQFTEVVKSQFNTLINCELFDAIRTKFCLCHIAIPALEADSAAVQTGCYPSMDQMAEMIPFVRFFLPSRFLYNFQIIEKFKLRRIYLFGVGVGSNIFLRYAVSFLMT